ncbi:DNRLRE domain-containing protein [bacterium]|nr:MAG: DNRLRE domain-containing protein [bacterium]
MPLSTSLALLFAALPGPNGAPPLIAEHFPSGPMNAVVPGQVLVKFRPSFTERLMARHESPRARTLSAANALPAESDIVPGGTVRSRIGKTGWTLWQVPTTTDVKTLARQLQGRPEVLTAQPVNRIYPLLVDPNDPDWNVYEDSEELIFSFEGDIEPFRRLWHLFDTNSPAAWAVWPNTYYTAATKPADPPLIAVIDTGCDMDHPDFRNAGGISTDTANGGQLDKSLSTRFELGEEVGGSPEDLNGHGTHVAGIALAAGNSGSFNGHGTLGVGYPCKGMILRVFDDEGIGSDADAAAAIYYAVEHGADVINISLGTTNFSQLFQDACTYAFQSGALVVAAGNENGSGGGDLGPIYPAACSGVLAVSANGENGVPATQTYSGIGSYIDIAAPGGDVLLDQNPLNPAYKIQFVWSTASRNPNTSLHNNPVLFPPYNLNYAYLAGTSMATPAVSGAAGLYYGKNNLDQRSGWGNLRTYRSLEMSAASVMGAPRGSWEPYQGYGCLDAESLLLDFNARGATVGGVEGIVYYNGTALANVTVRAQKAGSLIKYQTSTRPDGGYRFEMLPPGVYKVTAIPFGAAKTKTATVKAGSDQTGVDFWGGIYTGDETTPLVGRFDWLSSTATGFSVRHWAYDPETGIDRMSFRIGTAVGGTNVLADTEVLPESNVATFTGLTIPTFHVFQARYVNGGDQVTTMTRAVNPVVEDAYVRDGTYVNTNFGAAGSVAVRNTSAGYNRRGYLKIDTSSIPGAIKNVKIRFAAARWATTIANNVVEFVPTGTGWNQSTLTWNNAPAANGPAVASINITGPAMATNWYEVDVTSYVQSERAAGRPVVSLMLRSPVATDGMELFARENSTMPPRVTVTAQS